MWKQVTLIYFYELIDMEDKLAKLNQVKLNNKVCWRCDLALGVSLNKKIAKIIPKWITHNKCIEFKFCSKF
jgi:hypothetical protein